MLELVQGRSADRRLLQDRVEGEEYSGDRVGPDIHPMRFSSICGVTISSLVLGLGNFDALFCHRVANGLLTSAGSDLVSVQRVLFKMWRDRLEVRLVRRDCWGVLGAERSAGAVAQLYDQLRRHLSGHYSGMRGHVHGWQSLPGHRRVQLLQQRRVLVPGV